MHWGPINGKAVGGPNHSSAQQYSAETRQTWWRSAGSKSSGDESLLCYDGPRNEEPIELMHEDFQVHVDSDWVGDLLERKNTTGVNEGPVCVFLKRVCEGTVHEQLCAEQDGGAREN